MFERFNDTARKVVVLAQSEARELRHNWIGTEHLLLGLVRVEEGIAAQVLESLGVELETARTEVRRRIGTEQESDAPVTGQIPFTPRAKKVLELALREALFLGHNYIDTEHILLGIAREDEGLANRVLDDLGTDAETIRNETLSRIPKAPRWRGYRSQRIAVHPKSVRWEYLVERPDSSDGPTTEWLNALGADGWELVGVTATELGDGFVFKRRLQTPPEPPPEQEPEA